jgi:NAD(P)-dependent dehydrogenase (short-subunit alcohol dehydrogenase family)
VPGALLSTASLDLSDLNSVRDCTSRVLDSGKGIDVLLNNAGVMACPKMATKQGFEYQMGVNHLGHFLLTTSLLPLLQQSAG